MWSARLLKFGFSPHLMVQELDGRNKKDKRCLEGSNKTGVANNLIAVWPAM